MERVDGRTRRAGGGRGGSRRAGTPGPLGRAPGGGPGTRRALVARRRDQRDDRGPARRPGRAGAALALGGALGRGCGAARPARARGGGAALRARPRPGRAPSKREAALAVARDLLAAPVADRPVWTLARLAAEIRAPTREDGLPGRPPLA